MPKNVRVNEEDLLKALDRLENDAADDESEEVEKADALPKSTKEANGGLTGRGGEGEEADVDVDGNETDPTGASRKSTKASDEDDEEEVVEKADDSDSDSEDEEEGSEEDSEKSLSETLEEDDTVAKAVEISDFLEHLVDQTTDSVDGLRKSIRVARDDQREFNDSMRKAIVAMGNMLIELKGQMEDFGQGSAAPGPRSVMSKAVTAQSIAAPRFQGEAPEFTRDQALDALVDLAQQNKVNPAVVTMYETTGSLPREVQSMVDSYLRH